MSNPLFVSELFLSILECLAPSPSDSEYPARNVEERRSLVALARTCHAFSEPSLDHLWRHLDSLLPLIRSFAEVVDEVRAKTPPTPAEWLIINRYSNRIRELTLGSEPLSLHFVQCTNLVLFNLKFLRWVRPRRGVGPPQDERWMMTSTFYPIASRQPMLTPQIDTLDVALTHAGDPRLLSFINDYLLCTNLRSLKFNFVLRNGNVSATTIESLSRVLCSHAKWRHLDLPFPVDRAAFQHLGTCSTLKEVSLFLDRPQTSDSCFGQGDTPFRNVTNLSVSLSLWDQLGFITHLLRAQDQSFSSFYVTLDSNKTTVSEVSALLTAIVSPPRILSLRSMRVKRGLPPTSFSESPGLSYETLRPMASLVHLRELVISLNHPIPIDDDEFARLVCNWPYLEVLELVGRHTLHAGPSLTLKALTLLHASCQNIRHIGLTLDARKIPLNLPKHVRCPLVTWLLMEDCAIEDAEQVEAFLFKHLPLVPQVVVHTQPGFDITYVQLWVRVNEFMHARPTMDWNGMKIRIPPADSGLMLRQPNASRS